MPKKQNIPNTKVYLSRSEIKNLQKDILSLQDERNTEIMGVKWEDMQWNEKYKTKEKMNNMFSDIVADIKSKQSLTFPDFFTICLNKLMDNLIEAKKEQNPKEYNMEYTASIMALEATLKTVNPANLNIHDILVVNKKGELKEQMNIEAEPDEKLDIPDHLKNKDSRDILTGITMQTSESDKRVSQFIIDRGLEFTLLQSVHYELSAIFVSHLNQQNKTNQHRQP